jgi:hypothetical protein
VIISTSHWNFSTYESNATLMDSIHQTKGLKMETHSAHLNRPSASGSTANQLPGLMMKYLSQ